MDIFLRLELPEGVRILTYADDIVIYCVDRNNILTQLQTTLNTMVTAASTHGFIFAPEKSTATWFSRANPGTKLQLYKRDIDWSDRSIYLGVNIDMKLNMHSHIEPARNSVSRSLNSLKVMSSLSDVNSKIILRTCKACTRACLGYGAESFNILSLTQMRQLQRKQNTGLKFVLGVNKWSPTSNIHSELQFLPMAYRVEVFQANMINKLLLNAIHPLQEYLSAELVSPQPQNTRHKKKVAQHNMSCTPKVITLHSGHRYLSPTTPDYHQ